ncbi:MAG: hypothetical protein QXJ75_02970 [Candidatus Bathyarchaeia archaeon]
MKVLQVILPERVQIHNPSRPVRGIDLTDLEDRTGFDKKILINLNLDQIEDEI